MEKTLSLRFTLTGGLLLFAVVLVFEATGLAGSSRLLPLGASGVLAALVLVELARELAGGGDSGSSELGRPGTALAWTLALPSLMAILGFVAGAAIYVVAYSRLRSGEKWWRCAAGGAATALALTALLQWLLGISPPGSMLGG